MIVHGQDCGVNFFHFKKFLHAYFSTFLTKSFGYLHCIAIVLQCIALG